MRDPLSFDPESVDDDLEAALCACERSEGVVRSLLASADLEPLLEAVRLHDRSLRDLGALVMAWVASGGRIALEDADESDEPTAEVIASAEAVEPPAVEPPAAGPPPVEPPAPIEVAPTPPRVAASAASLQALVDKGLDPDWSRDQAGAVSLALLHELLDDLGPPEPIVTPQQRTRELKRLTSATKRVEQWRYLDRQPQRELLGLWSSRARHVQDECERGLTPQQAKALSADFSAMTKFSDQARPGWVPGLSRDNTPERRTWLEDARHWWNRLRGPTEGEGAEAPLARLAALLESEPSPQAIAQAVKECRKAGVAPSDTRLVRLLAPYADLLKGNPSLKTTRGAIQKLQKTDREQAEREVYAPSSDWPLRAQCAGRRVTVLGGDRRIRVADRYKQAFGFAEVSWEGGEIRRVGALAERVQGGSVDLVLILKSYISHKAIALVVPACNDRGVPFAVVDSGYGVKQVELALERFLPRKQGGRVSPPPP